MPMTLISDHPDGTYDMFVYRPDYMLTWYPYGEAPRTRNVSDIYWSREFASDRDPSPVQINQEKLLALIEQPK